MFTYLNPTIRQRLVDEHKLIRIDAKGREIPINEAPADNEIAVNILGPIPLPIQLGDVQITTQWYATVRSTELAKVEEVADEPVAAEAIAWIREHLPPDDDPARLLHGDLLGHNVLFDFDDPDRSGASADRSLSPRWTASIGIRKVVS